ncbi:MarR family winged helix-turn-helix transcriptional regulator [Amycolatopsis sp. PS_44_ISF1]|uniref:MarR family winged helix-turn-helix transcriptional regulator n=1 Tax=Amycolatopsis sp. PS_44_ISF1 TaxID=2974917 RepID=UPI0028DD515E|nr:MarR family winged helix-turn-helix transcriptional regulator [Amycolatopsis sp. PS_44_ISF1]MDT8915159.1 MarR family winged helix-turn-helix transcriptional regulator [Amycolatopsis sp. PS_44_ISF1]
MGDRRDSALRISQALRDLLAEAGPAQQGMAARLGIGKTDAQALQHLASAGRPIGTVELAHLLGIRSASAASLVDRLEAAGHVRRQAHTSDRRRVTLTVSETAQGAVHAALRPMLTDLATLIERLTEEQAATVADFLDRSLTLLRSHRDPAAGSRPQPVQARSPRIPGAGERTGQEPDHADRDEAG